MITIGIDIGSTASKAVVMEDSNILHSFVTPTSWSSKETANNIKKEIEKLDLDKDKDKKTIATGYGRISVPFADKSMSEITCHGIGGSYLFSDNNDLTGTIIDIGGQDTKIITLSNGKVTDFLMNDKCSAGTGKFIEIMANRLGISIDELSDLARTGEPLTISSMCTVFAESEIISFIGSGEPRENIARGIIDSVAEKVSSLAYRHGINESLFLTGGLCENKAILNSLSNSLESEIKTNKYGRFAGAIGAAILAEDI